MMCRPISAIALAFTVAALSPTTSTASFKVIESNSSRLVLSWELPSLDTGSILENGGLRSTMTFSGSNVDVAKPGTPSQPALSFIVGVPPSGDISVRLEPQKIETIRLSHPSRVRDRNAREHSSRFSDPWVSEPEFDFFREIRSAQMIIRPIAFDNGGHSCRVVTKATLTITFPSHATNPSPPQSTSPYYAVARDLIINFDVARQWSADRSSLRKGIPIEHSPLSGALIRFPIGDGTANDNEGTVRENGVIRIYSRDLPPGLGSSVNIDNLALYASQTDTLSVIVPQIESIPTGVIEIPMIRVDENGNGVFDGNDYLLAYVSAISDWRPVRVGRSGMDFRFQLHPYENYRSYWIGTKSSGSGLRPERFESPMAGSPDTATDFINLLMLRRSASLPTYRDSRNVVHPWEGGAERIWQRLSTRTGNFSYPVDLTGADISKSAWVRFNGDSEYGVSVLPAVGPVTINPPVLQSEAYYPIDLQKTGTRTTVALTFRDQGSGEYYDLKEIEFRYHQPLSMAGLTGLTIYSRPDTGLVTYQLTGLPETKPYWIFRIPANEGQISIIPNQGGTSCTWTDTSGIGVRYYVCTVDGLRTLPSQARAVPAMFDGEDLMRDLRRERSKCNYLIVTHANFLPAARALADHKRNHGTFPTPSPGIVLIDDVYRLFSGGNTDPSALRNFLAFAHAHWNGLEYVTLMGNGNYDYRQTLSTEEMFIPTGQFGARSDQKCVEDFFAALQPGKNFNSIPDIMLGRLPCLTLDQALAMVEKIRDIEDPARADFGAWRNRMLLVADDDMQGRDIDYIPHHSQSDNIERIILERAPWTETRKVYLFEYPFDDLGEKPAAARALVNEINNGVAYVNYFGHGADVVWADEHILVIDNLANFANSSRYPVITSFSCSVGRFDVPGQPCLSDALVTKAGVGGIAAVSSTRIAFATSNENLASVFFRQVFNPDTVLSIGQAYMKAMVSQGSGQFTKTYCLLGDPSIIMANAKRRIDLSVLDENGNRTDTLMALQRITVKGTIGFPGVGGNLTPDPDFGRRPAYVQIGILNPADTSRRKDGGTASVTPYTLPGSPIFVGRTTVSNGTFTQNLLLPRNLSFGRAGARIVAYAWQGPQAAVGHHTGFLFKGTMPFESNDTVGPRITIRPVYNDTRRNSPAAFADGITASLPMELEIELFDESGINVVGIAPDEGLTMEIPGALAKSNLNHLFQFREGDFRLGKANMAFKRGDLDTGTHSITITAQDLLGYTTAKTFRIHIIAEEDFRLGPVYNYPNPVRYGSSTRFFFYTSTPNLILPNNSPQMRADIKIYTLAGKLIRILKNVPNGVVWDCRDQRGELLTPNVYLYRIYAVYPGNKSRKERSAVEKLVIKPPK